MGKGVRRDDKHACKWLSKSAAHGYARAQCRLGLMYELGSGVTENKKRAYELLSNAAEQGEIVSLYSLDLLHPDKVNVPRLLAEFATEVEQHFLELKEELALKQPRSA